MRSEREKDMATSKFDIVILGASGFTGKQVLKEALKFLNNFNSLAIAGRDPSKLAQALNWAARPNPPPPIPILAADTADAASLRDLCGRARLLLNCVGPFRLHGEPVVAACVAAGCDYLDITGETEFMERVEREYHAQAVKNETLVVSACGFDSVPAEMGFLFHSRQWVGPARPNRVEAYLGLESEKRIVGNFGTFESAVMAVKDLKEMEQPRVIRVKPKV